MYTFRNKCLEEPELELKDETTKIFLNATGRSGEINSDIKAFLRYVNSGKVKVNLQTV